MPLKIVDPETNRELPELITFNIFSGKGKGVIPKLNSKDPVQIYFSKEYYLNLKILSREEQESTITVEFELNKFIVEKS